MKKIIRLLLCTALLVTALWFLQRLLVPKYFGDVTEGAFTAEYYRDEPDHEVLFLGDCEAYENFDPVYLWEHYGINSYIRGSAQQLVWQSYYMLEDALRYETPKVVVMNVLAMKYNEPQSEAYNRITLEGMKWGLPKIRAINASMTEEEHFIEYVFPLLRYHDRLFKLSSDDLKYMFKTERVSYNGYYLRVDTKPAENVPGGKQLTDYNFGDKAWKYMNMIADLCEKKGIDLILVKAPSLYPYWYSEWEEQIEEYAAKRDLKYINYLELTEETGLDLTEDTYDGGLHLNVYGADKITEHLGKVLSEEYGLTDRSGETELAAAWDEKIRLYYNEISRQLEEAKAGQTPEVTKTPEPTPGIKAPEPKTGGYIFSFKGVDVAMDAEAKALTKDMPEAKSVYEAPSCAFEGVDRVYDYGSFELNTYEVSGTEYVSAVIFKDDLVETGEGAYIGMTIDEVEALYGSGTEEGNGRVYEKGGMKLRFFLKEGHVSQIQYLSTILE
ncbi:MAG: SGNH/GDSL hydrolase family protein [Lachnospiraceae bacterium]|nr:SGNH/GDSL hydrolase family protein [Lachnospiraceae bacterium]